MKYTKEQIKNAIAKWSTILEGLEPKQKPASIKQKIKEGVEAVGSVASLAKSAGTIASQVEPAMKLMQELIKAINRGAAAMEKLAASRGIK